jgi:hypothetical protein
MKTGFEKSGKDRTVGAPTLILAGAFLVALVAWLNLRIGADRPANMIILRATAFESGGEIPKRFTCQGADVSPALTWTEPPAGTKSFVLIADDPDAPMGTFVHWVVYDLPATARRLPEAIAGNDEMGGGGRQGMNDFPMSGYGGPCPPPGKYHRYFFRLYALDTMLDLKGGATRREVDRAMQGHVLAQAGVMGRFRR